MDDCQKRGTQKSPYKEVSKFMKAQNLNSVRRKRMISDMLLLRLPHTWF